MAIHNFLFVHFRTQKKGITMLKMVKSVIPNDMHICPSQKGIV